VEFLQTMVRSGSRSPVNAMAWTLSLLAGLIGHCVLTPEAALGQTGLGEPPLFLAKWLSVPGGLAVGQERTQIRARWPGANPMSILQVNRA